MPEKTLTGPERAAAEQARIDARLEATRQELLERRVAIATFDGHIGKDGSAITVERGWPLPRGHRIVLAYPDRFRSMTEREIENQLRSLRYLLGA